ncbi:MAG: hypothetical protein ACLSHU_14015 [Oscillospiraceae bacterium]
MSYLVGAGLTLVVLLGCLPLLNHSGETPPDPSDASHHPSATQETEVIAASTKPTQPGPDCPAILRELLGGIRRPMISWRAIRGTCTTCRWT